MAVDVLNNELIGMSDDQIMQLISFARFLKYDSQNRSDIAEVQPRTHRRTPGGMPGKLWMADDFDETPSCFAEYL